VQRFLPAERLYINFHQPVKAVQKDGLAQKDFKVAGVQAGRRRFPDGQVDCTVRSGKERGFQRGQRAVQVKRVTGLPESVIGAVKDGQGFAGGLVVARLDCVNQESARCGRVQAGLEREVLRVSRGALAPQVPPPSAARDLLVYLVERSCRVEREAELRGRELHPCPAVTQFHWRGKGFRQALFRLFARQTADWNLRHAYAAWIQPGRGSVGSVIFEQYVQAEK